MSSPSRASATLPTVTLFEHEAISYDELGVHSDDQFLSELEQLNALSGEDLVRLGRRHLRATKFVGVSPEMSHHGIDSLAAGFGVLDSIEPSLPGGPDGSSVHPGLHTTCVLQNERSIAALRSLRHPLSLSF